MIIAEFFKKDEEIIGFNVKGHAGYAEVGEDIVCASVSSAVQLAANMITDSFKIKADVKVSGDSIFMRVKNSEDKSYIKVFCALYEHIKILSEDYEGTITITLSEV